MKRPTIAPGTMVTTPRVGVLMKLLGPGINAGSVTWSRDEFAAVRKLYGFQQEKPNRKPDPPKDPVREDFKSEFAYEGAVRKHQATLKELENWRDPRCFMQAGADRNAIRHAEIDGLRLLAWIAKFVPPGEDPLKALVQMANSSGYDVDHEDTEWADTDELSSSDTGSE